jgi:hypothetical protein
VEYRKDAPVLTQCEQRILPGWNRFVVFSTTDFSWHGHPTRLNAPTGRMRRALGLYYYTKGRPAAECQDGDCSGKGHGTIFVKGKCKMCTQRQCAALPASGAISRG